MGMCLGYNARVFLKTMLEICAFSLKSIINSISSYLSDRCIAFSV